MVQFNMRCDHKEAGVCYTVIASSSGGVSVAGTLGGWMGTMRMLTET